MTPEEFCKHYQTQKNHLDRLNQEIQDLAKELLDLHTKNHEIMDQNEKIDHSGPENLSPEILEIRLPVKKVKV